MKITSFFKKLVIILLPVLFIAACSKDDNQVPNAPLNISPQNEDTNVSVLPNMVWSACADPDNDSVRYDLYLGATNPPSLMAADLKIPAYIPDTLDAYTKYYWKVVAKDVKNNAASSGVWNFTTGAVKLPGDLAVMVSDITQSNYYGGAEVFLYKAEADRTNDPARNKYYRKAITDNSDPQDLGAVFYELQYQKYYVFCRVDLGGGNLLTGVSESYVSATKLTKLHVAVQ